MRSFIAINLPDTVKSDIDEISNRLRDGSPPARWVPAANVHITLKFLDEIRDDQIGPVTQAIGKAVKGTGPFEIALGGFGVFPNPRQARVFWVGIESGVETLKELAHAIDRQVHELGFPLEKRGFSAHLTLARLRQPGPADQLLAMAGEIPYRSEPIPAARIDLMRSVLAPGGAQYSILDSVALEKT
jgi:2'-5' RNA ligase